MNSKHFKTPLLFIMAVILTLGLSISFQSLLAAWTAPLANPPACLTGNPGCDAPISSGSTLVQQAQGSLWIVNSSYPTSPYGLIVEQGKVVIGAMTSSYKLDVQGGQINSSGGFCIAGVCKATWAEIFSAGTGISITGTTITNSAPDKTISLTGAGGTTIAGTYPNFTITSTDSNTTYTAGTGISITGTTITNSAPDKTISLTGAGSTTIAGTYPNFTITSTDSNTTYTAGTGITISGTTITNSGDTNAADDITSLIAGTGITISSSGNSRTITNLAPDKTISLTGAGGTTITGAYPNFTITSASQQSVAWSEITDKPTNLSGYGITDAAPISHAHDGYLTPSSYIDFSKITGNKYSYTWFGSSCLSGDTPIAYRTVPTTCNSTDCSSGSCTTGSHQWLPTRQSLETCSYNSGIEYYIYDSSYCYLVPVTCYAQEYVLCVPSVCPSCGVGEICKSGQCYKPPYKAVFADGSTQYFDSLNVIFDLRAVAPVSAVINGVGVGFGSISRTLSLGSYTVSLTSDNGDCDSCGGGCEGVYGKIIFSDGVGKIITNRANRTAGCIVATEFNNGWVDTQCCGNCCYTNYQTTFTVSNNN